MPRGLPIPKCVVAAPPDCTRLQGDKTTAQCQWYVACVGSAAFVSDTAFTLHSRPCALARAQRFVVCVGLRPEFANERVRAEVVDFLLTTNERFTGFGKLQRRKKITINPNEDVVRIVPAAVLRSVCM